MEVLLPVGVFLYFYYFSPHLKRWKYCQWVWQLLSHYLDFFQTHQLVSSLFKLVSVAIKGTWIKVGHVHDNREVAQTRNSYFHFARLTWNIEYHSWLSVISQWSMLYSMFFYKGTKWLKWYWKKVGFKWCTAKTNLKSKW